ncbi:exonuclease, partial [Planctomycetota bacterium]|nr:exonuclease [Planctomycetota bacterium]
MTSRALAQQVQVREHWRLFPELRGHARYIDIETTGLDLREPITMVCVSDGRGSRVLVKGVDLTQARLARLLKGARLLVTFNGLQFDV